MKSFFIWIFKTIGFIASLIWPYSLFNQVGIIKTKLHTFWLFREFKKLGNSTSINYPISLVGGEFISIGSEVVLGKRGVLTAWRKYLNETYSPSISIGSGTSIGEDYHITAVNAITIGENVLIGKKVTISDNAHGETTASALNNPPLLRPIYTKGAVTIEDNVWIGDKVTILANVTVGKNAIIGANALVTKDVPQNCVVGGIPARVIKQIV